MFVQKMNHRVSSRIGRSEIGALCSCTPRTSAGVGAYRGNSVGSPVSSTDPVRRTSIIAWRLVQPTTFFIIPMFDHARTIIYQLSHHTLCITLRPGGNPGLSHMIGASTILKVRSALTLLCHNFPLLNLTMWSSISSLLLVLLVCDPAVAQTGRNLDQFTYRSTSGSEYGPEDWDQVLCPDKTTCVSSNILAKRRHSSDWTTLLTLILLLFCKDWVA